MRLKNGGKNYREAVLSGLLVIFGIGLLYFAVKIVDQIIDEVMVLKPNNFLYKEWKDPSIGIKIDFYYFNWTNPEDLMNTSVKPKFREIGPLTFNEEVHKCNITFNDNNTVSYRNYKILYLDEDKSGAKFDVNITTLNVIPLIASEKSRSWNFFYRKGLSIALQNIPDYKTATAEEWLFEGFEDSFLNAAKYLPFMEDIPNMEKFAWFLHRNGSYTYEGFYNIGTGMGNTTLGKTYEWNFRNRSDYSGHCGELDAPTELYPQNIQKDKLELFFPDFCRKIILDYNETLLWHGVEAYKFNAGVNFLDNGKHNPENTCLCNRKCFKFGVIDYSRCKFGIPGYLSLPHFNKADPQYSNDIEGMKPNDDKHKIEIIINPRTGIILDATMAIQLNLFLEQNPSISKYRNVPELMFPVFWFSVNTQIDMRSFILLTLILRLEVILKTVSFISIVVGLALQIRFFYSFSKKNENRKCMNKKCDRDNLNLLHNKSCCDKV